MSKGFQAKHMGLPKMMRKREVRRGRNKTEWKRFQLSIHEKIKIGKRQEKIKKPPLCNTGAPKPQNFP